MTPDQLTSRYRGANFLSVMESVGDRVPTVPSTGANRLQSRKISRDFDKGWLVTAESAVTVTSADKVGVGEGGRVLGSLG